MTINNHKLPLKYSPYTNHCLSWSISDEILYGEHDFKGLEEVLLNDGEVDPRRYAEVLYHKTGQYAALIVTIKECIEKKARSDPEGAERLSYSFRDWDIKERANQCYRENLKAGNPN